MTTLTPAFQCMLAASEIPTEDQIRLPAMVSFKFDGFRGLPVNSTVMSREWKEVPCLKVRNWAKENADLLFGLDGELMAGDPTDEEAFNRAQKQFTRADGDPDFKFYVFGMVWNYDKSPVYNYVAKIRYELLKRRLAEHPVDRVVLVEQRWIETLPQLKAMYAESLALGYEGLIGMDPNKTYKFGRSTLLEGILWKWKEWADAEAVVTGIQQGTKNMNEQTRDALGKAERSSAKAGKVPVDMVGSFLVRGLTGPHAGKDFKVGPGSLKEEEAREIWKRFQSGAVVGEVLTYKFQKGGTTKKPRFPGFKAFRPELQHLAQEK